MQTEVTGRSLKAGLKWAGKLGASLALILGEAELESGVVSIRDLAPGMPGGGGPGHRRGAGRGAAEVARDLEGEQS